MGVSKSQFEQTLPFNKNPISSKCISFGPPTGDHKLLDTWCLSFISSYSPINLEATHHHITDKLMTRDVKLQFNNTKNQNLFAKFPSSDSMRSICKTDTILKPLVLDDL